MKRFSSSAGKDTIRIKGVLRNTKVRYLGFCCIRNDNFRWMSDKGFSCWCFIELKRTTPDHVVSDANGVGHLRPCGMVSCDGDPSESLHKNPSVYTIDVSRG